jgi:hypothetical protein
MKNDDKILNKKMVITTFIALPTLELAIIDDSEPERKPFTYFCWIPRVISAP